MQDLEGKPIILSGKPAEFTAKDFTSTKFATAEDKAKWANKFTKFILGGFQRSSFKKEIYKQLHNMFGHCAEYDLDGFYSTWFVDTHKCLHWVETIATTWLVGIGQPQFTWSEQKERATLKLLQHRYGVLPITNATQTGELALDPTPMHIEIHLPVQEVGQLKLF